MDFQTTPPRFRELGLQGAHTNDGFWMGEKPLSDLLLEKNIRTFPNDQGEERECALFFDDWHLYAIPAGTDWVYSLVKLREQEFDAAQGRIGDGDTPGVTVSFIDFRVEIFQRCLAEPTLENRRDMNREINRVVSLRGQGHHPALKAYFEKTQAQGPYLIGWEYVRKIASLAENGRIALPEILRKAPDKRISEFLASLNRRAGRTVADGENIYLRHGEQLSDCEVLAILAAFTANW